MVCVKEKSRQKIVAGEDQRDERERTADEASKLFSISIKTGGLAVPQDKPRGCLFIAWVVLGVKAA